MTCDETRELLSALLDEALDTGERARVEAHLVGCPDCRREVDGLRATRGLLARVERARAPVGFVDRVMTQVRPVPWYRLLGRALFFPLSVKIPLEAGAMVVVAVLGVYLVQTTPELKDAARRDAPSASSPPSIERSAPSAPSAAAPPLARDREKESRQALMPQRPPASSDRTHRRQAHPPLLSDQHRALLQRRLRPWRETGRRSPDRRSCPSGRRRRQIGRTVGKLTPLY